jgi:hypothetical protein
LNAASLCRGDIAVTTPVGPGGSFTTPLTVGRTGKAVTGETVDCTSGPGACVAFAIQYVSWSQAPGIPIPTAISAGVPISFRAESFSDCAASTWRTFTDARGHAFRNRIGCYVSVLLLKLLGR